MGVCACAGSTPKLNEAPEPNAPGRWLAWIEGNRAQRHAAASFIEPSTGFAQEAPHGLYAPDLTVAFPNFPGPRSAVRTAKEHEAEVLPLGERHARTGGARQRTRSHSGGRPHRGQAAGAPGEVRRIDDRAKR